MGTSRLPFNGFIGLLTGHDPFDIHFKRIVISATVRLGLFPQIDERLLRHTLAIWREAVAQWIAELDVGAFADVGHIKMAGALLWSIIQDECCPVDAVVPMTGEHRSAVKAFGAAGNIRDLQPGRGDVYRASPNAALGFVFATTIFNSIQRARGIPRAGINLGSPPMTPHYFYNLCCWYLVAHDPGKEDLYMIYKTMDLYALKHPRSDGFFAL
jgi:hypothetical protein